MTKKRFAWRTGILVVLAFGIISSYYFFSLTPPGPIPSTNKLLKTLNQTIKDNSYEERDIKVSSIQDTKKLDDNTIFTPFKTSSGSYGYGVFTWERLHWKVHSMDTEGTPAFVSVDSDDPTTYFFVWNFDPEEPVSTLYFYFLQDRNYNMEAYFPGVQMEQQVTINSTDYGSLEFPTEWRYLLTEGKDPNNKSVFSTSPSFTQLGWLAENSKGEVFSPKKTVRYDNFSYMDKRTNDNFYFNQLYENDLEK
ncbi:hypothetical protein Pryu01_01965 [Paraliobacillus ryukyuensis]|uniref:Uncharacterized protein n=1 Tax=Paraliobacillus ryukyuensis TaxID=200904 RepID=A0A366DYS1_9BACI|nr:hypothetical protein [Paraliobacillus ryukyuensis]RBO95232.1 hypothetical protein DES48_10969 [Paraliobacillus ryukyuensis]